ncbi:MAG: IclR family transcriptional regulator [Bradyrhizobium sp.]|jgi:IclR family pca regulon transcriptional regulator|nr:IclR family transcriptional regulator [Bradyrhizobium sp.]MEA2866909.1 IclR family transcriptional regulator, pca regulon regulatory protein [Bradyrhizobium sp.]
MMLKTTEKPRSQSFVTAFARGLTVIEAFGGGAETLSLAEIAARSGVDRAVARRSLLTLIELGYAVFEKKNYRLTPRILRLGYAYLSQSGMDGRLQPFVEAVAKKTGESCSVSILDGLETVSVAHAPSIHKMGFLLKPGTRMPAYVMTSGRVLLAAKSDDEAIALLRQMDRKAMTKTTRTSLGALMESIRKIRDAGYATIEEELEVGLLSIAMPIRNRRGETVASLNVSSSAARTTLADLCKTALPVMRQTAIEIGSVLP